MSLTGVRESVEVGRSPGESFSSRAWRCFLYCVPMGSLGLPLIQLRSSVLCLRDILHFSELCLGQP